MFGIVTNKPMSKRTLKAHFFCQIDSVSDPLHLAGSGSGSTSISAPDPDPDPDPLRFLSSDPDPLLNRIRIHFFQMWIRGSGSTITERWIRGSGSTFPKCGSQNPDPDPRQNEMDPKRCFIEYLIRFITSI